MGYDPRQRAADTAHERVPDVIPLAEDYLTLFDSQPDRYLGARGITRQLIAELKAERVEHNQLQALVNTWYTIAANQAVAEGTQWGYRECAGQLAAVLRGTADHG